ncbi:hypothetical protein Mar181_2219 [Marinomonas posidonica IVIA-Po-181]|uniref:Uncharacterized protein n=1 Tax=Marinomonas posidonica (strain CECT 7376 / NCIMB 14433 / IVIA-Po-181) TaxID=491952 RepID=F6CUD7_MARPP|nr:hypothetical protein Mar181_2219 [Marinomonas posidonica IVIA-Po-181]
MLRRVYYVNLECSNYNDTSSLIEGCGIFLVV